ncbi:MAG: Ig-like domain-containing protein [Balneolales bacterium]
MLLTNCATPTQPTGGERDTSGPEVVQTTPQSGTVNFAEDHITFEFDDYVNRANFERAFRMEPDMGIDYSLNWGRRSVRVRFEDDLPDTTTIILTVGTDLTDTNNNKMASPFQLALSTGPDIDSGKISATVRDAETGEVIPDARVLLYRSPYDLAEKANYSAGTDTAGVASFNYLREGHYRGFWVDDRNRNQVWDPPREDAQPFPTDTLSLGRDQSASFATVFITREDTLAPELQAVGLLSSTRMRLRFSENVELGEEAAIDLFTLDQEPFSRAIPLYVDEGEPNILFAQSVEEFIEEELFTLELHDITDGAGNPAYSGIDSFEGSGEPDTTYLAYLEHLTEAGVYANEPLIFQYSKVIDEEVVTDSLKVIESDSLFEDWPGTDVRENKLVIHPDTVWRENVSYEVRIWNPESAGYVNIEPTIWHEDDLGELELLIEGPAEEDTASYRYTLTDGDETPVRSGRFADTLVLDQLPPRNYKLIVFEDLDGSGRWDPGSVEPFRAPEPYFIQRNIPVQSNMTGQVYVDFNGAGETGRTGEPDREDEPGMDGEAGPGREEEPEGTDEP